MGDWPGEFREDDYLEHLEAEEETPKPSRHDRTPAEEVKAAKPKERSSEDGTVWEKPRRGGSYVLTEDGRRVRR